MASPPLPTPSRPARREALRARVALPPTARASLNTLRHWWLGASFGRCLCTLWVMALVLAGSAAGSAARAQTHKVRSGEVLGGIAEKYGCGLSALRKANRLRGDAIRAGQTLKLPRVCKRLPGRGDTTARAVASGGKAGSKSGGKSGGKSTEKVSKAKGRGTARRRGPVKHLIKRGENLGRIASKYGCTAAEIRKANKRRTDRIQAGKTLVIPLCYTDDSGRRRVSLEERRALSKAAVRPSLDQAAVTAGLPPLRDDLADGLHPVDTVTLAKAMRARGFHPPPKFKALVVEITLDDQETTVLRERWFDYEGTAQHTDWNVGSTIKIFAAIAALEYLASHRLTLKAAVTFFDSRRREKVYKVADLIHDALSRSDNIAYNRLVQLAGYDFMNGAMLKDKLGLKFSGIHRPYEVRSWIPLTGAREFRHSPQVLISHGKHTQNVPERTGSGDYACMGHAACSTLNELAVTMRLLMLTELLPENEQLSLDAAALDAMREALSAKKKRGTELADGLRAAFNDGAVVIYHKPGFAENWMSDVAYVAHLDTSRRWIVAVAGYPGRTSIVSAAHAIGHVLANDDLERPWPGTPRPPTAPPPTARPPTAPEPTAPEPTAPEPTGASPSAPAGDAGTPPGAEPPDGGAGGSPDAGEGVEGGGVEGGGVEGGGVEGGGVEGGGVEGGGVEGGDVEGGDVEGGGVEGGGVEGGGVEGGDVEGGGVEGGGVEGGDGE